MLYVSILCPYCKSNLIDEIPDNLKSLYGRDYWDRRIGVYNVETKVTEKWICNVCFKMWINED